MENLHDKLKEAAVAHVEEFYDFESGDESSAEYYDEIEYVYQAMLAASILTSSLIEEDQAKGKIVPFPVPVVYHPPDDEPPRAA